MSTLAEETLLALEAKQRRVHRENVESQATAVEKRIGKLDGEIADKKKLLVALAALEAAAIELPPQVQARRSGIGGSTTIPCLRSELRSSLAGAIGVQSARLDNLVVRQQADAKQLDQLRAAITGEGSAGFAVTATSVQP